MSLQHIWVEVGLGSAADNLSGSSQKKVSEVFQLDWNLFSIYYDCTCWICRISPIPIWYTPWKNSSKLGCPRMNVSFVWFQLSLAFGADERILMSILSRHWFFQKNFKNWKVYFCEKNLIKKIPLKGFIIVKKSLSWKLSSNFLIISFSGTIKLKEE